MHLSHGCSNNSKCIGHRKKAFPHVLRAVEIGRGGGSKYKLSGPGVLEEAFARAAEQGQL